MDENKTNDIIVTDEVMNKLLRGYSRNAYKNGVIDGAFGTAFVIGSGALIIGGGYLVGSLLAKAFKSVCKDENKEETQDGCESVQE